MIILSNTIIVLADDTEDLLNVYNLTLGDSTKSEIMQEIDSIMQEINNTEFVKDDIESYNAVLQAFLQERENQIDKVKDDIVSFTNKNETLTKSLEESLLNGDIKDILTYDSTIKRNSITINELFESLEFFTYDYSFKSYSADIDGLTDKLKDAQQIYIDSLDTYNLGDVNSIEFISDKRRKVSTKYGYYINPNKEIRFHSGVDYECPEGSNVYALFNGEVISVGSSKVIGNFITVQSGDNIKYLVCHLNEVLVSEGDIVKQYDCIGLTGSTGSQCTSPSLHLSLYINGCTYDPDLLFAKSEKYR